MRILAIVVLLILGCELSAQLDYCVGPVHYAPINAEGTETGHVLSPINPVRESDRELCFSRRYYRKIRIHQDTAAYGAEGCGLLQLLHRTGDLCEAQYINVPDCDSAILSLNHKMNSLIAGGASRCDDGYDVYRYPFVTYFSDTMISMEIREVYMPWDDKYAAEVEAFRLKRMALKGELDTTKQAMGEIMKQEGIPQLPEINYLSPRGDQALERCVRCEKYAGSLNGNPSRDIRGTMIGLTFDPRDFDEFPDPVEILGEDWRKVVHKHVVNWNKDHPDLEVNEYHYRPKEMRQFMYAFAEDHFIVYIGNEGEFGAYWRLRIPFAEFE